MSITAQDLRDSYREVQFLQQIRDAGLPEPRRHYSFDDTKRHLDFAWPGVAVEIQGGTWIRGAHTRGKGYANDRRKLNFLTMAGWIVLEYTSDMLDANEAIPDLLRLQKLGKLRAW